jgi:hypothetical protein
MSILTALSYGEATVSGHDRAKAARQSHKHLCSPSCSREVLMKSTFEEVVAPIVYEAINESAVVYT